jgi:threonine efflux protein
MSYAWILAGLALANMLGILSPGPAFLMVTRAAAGQGMRQALGVGAGIALAAASWSAAAAFGISVLMVQLSSVYGIVQLLGGAYLIWLGISAWRGAGHAAPEAPALRVPARGFGRSVAVGAALSLGNPKIVVFFSSIFVALLPVAAPLWLRIAVVAIVVVQEFTWYTLVAMVFSRPRVQAGYRRLAGWIERIMGTVLIGFGSRLIVSARLWPAL